MVNTYPEGMPINVATLNKSPMVTDLLSLETGGSPPTQWVAYQLSRGQDTSSSPMGHMYTKFDVTMMLLA